MVQQQLDLFDWRADADDHFFVIEVADEQASQSAFPLDVFLAAFRMIYGYSVAFLIVFAFSSWLGMAIGDAVYLSPLHAINHLFPLLFEMVVFPAFWPIFIIQIGCLFFPIRRDTTDAMVLSLVVLLMINCVAFAYVADMARL